MAPRIGLVAAVTGLLDPTDGRCRAARAEAMKEADPVEAELARKIGKEMAREGQGEGFGVGWRRRRQKGWRGSAPSKFGPPRTIERKRSRFESRTDGRER